MITLTQFEQECKTKTLAELKNIQDRLSKDIERFNQMLESKEVSEYVNLELKSIIVVEQEYAESIADIISKKGVSSREMDDKTKELRKKKKELIDKFTKALQDYSNLENGEWKSKILEISAELQVVLFDLCNTLLVAENNNYDDPANAQYGFMLQMQEYIIKCDKEKVKEFAEQIESLENDKVEEKQIENSNDKKVDEESSSVGLESRINKLVSNANLTNSKEIVQKMIEFFKQYSEDTANDILDKVSKYDDIFGEFCEWINYPDWYLGRGGYYITEQDYSAKDILEKEPSIPPHTAFIFLTELRDNKKQIVELVKNGIPADNTLKLAYNVDQIEKYLKYRGVSDNFIKDDIKKYYRNPDIANEFEYWIRTGDYVENNPVIVEGYTAKRLHEEYGDKLKNEQVFEWLLYLRTKPDDALDLMKRGFPIK